MASVTEYLDTLVGGTWTNSANAVDGNDLTDYASTITDAQYVTGRDAGSFSTIPDGAMIDGILVEIYCYGDGGDYLTVDLYDGSSWSTAYNNTPTTSATWRSIGGSTEKWGKTWTAATIKSSDFQTRFTYHNSTKANTMYAYATRVTVYYTSTTPVTPNRVGVLWNVKNQVSTTDKLVWNDKNLVSTTDTYIYNTRGSLSASVIMSWNLAVLVKRTVAMKMVYNMRNIVDKTPLLMYNIRARTSTKFKAVYYNYTYVLRNKPAYLILMDSTSMHLTTVLKLQNLGSAVATIYNSDELVEHISASGKYGGCLIFDATKASWYSGYTFTTAYTIGFWIKSTSLSSNKGIMGKGATSTTALMIHTDTSGYVHFTRSESLSPYTHTEVVSATPITTDTWYHVTVKDTGGVGGTMSIKIDDGEWVSTTRAGASTPTLGGNSWWIGDDGSVIYSYDEFLGYMDNLFVYESAVSDDIIREIMNNEIWGKKTRLIYNDRNLVSAASVKLVYTITAGAEMVVATVEFAYGVNNIVSMVQDYVYNVRGWLPSDSPILLWNIRNSVPSTTTLKYSIRNLVSFTTRLIYNIGGRISGSVKAVYNLRNPVFSGTTIVYNILTSILVSTTVKLVYNIAGKLTVFLRPIYNIRKVLWEIAPTSLTLISKYDETSGSYAYDSSGNGYTGTLTSVVFNSAGKYDYCVYSDGATGDRVDYGNVLNIRGSITISLWVKPTSDARVMWLVTKMNSTGYNCTYRLALAQGATYLIPQLLRANGTTWITSVTGTAVSVNEWHFIAVTVDSSTGNARLLVDDTWYDGTTETAGDSSDGSAWPLYVGEGYNGGTSRSVVGYIDDVRITNSVLTDDQIYAIKIHGLTRKILYNVSRPIISTIRTLAYKIRKNVTDNPFFYNEGIDVHGWFGNAVETDDYYYVVAQGAGRDPYITRYDKARKRWATPVKVGETPLPTDGHGAPAMIRDSSGYLHVWFGAHTSPNEVLQYYRSTNPDDISTWTNHTADSSPGWNNQLANYPCPFLDPLTGRMFILFRTYQSEYHWAYKYSDDGGDTWSSYASILDYESSNIAYLPENTVWSETVGGHFVIHITFVYHSYTLGYRHNVYYVKFDTYDNKVYNVAGTEMTSLPITYSSANTNLIVKDTSNLHAWGSAFGKNSAGTPLVVFMEEYSAGQYRYSSLEYTGGTWTNQATICALSYTDRYTPGIFKSGTTNIALIDDDDTNILVFEYNWTTHSWTQIGVAFERGEVNSGNVWRWARRQHTDTPTFISQEVGTTPYAFCLAEVDESDGSISKIPYKRDTVLKYNIKNLVSKTRTLVYNILSGISVSTVVKLVYNIRNRTTATASLIWHLGRAVITAVTTLVYSMRNRLAKLSTILWNIRAARTASVKLMWSVRSALTTSVRLIWNLRAVRTASVKLLYNIKNRVSDALTVVYSIGGALRVVVGIVYNVRNRITSADKFIYNIRAIRTALVSISYRIRGSVSASVKLLYNIFGRLAASVRLTYNIRGILEVGKVLVWNVRSSLSAGVSIVWTGYAYVKSAVKFFWTLGEVVLRQDPYKQLFDELKAWIETETGAGGQFEGFRVYARPNRNQTLVFPCIVLDMERGDSSFLFGGRYEEGGTITVKLMFTKRQTVIYSVDVM